MARTLQLANESRSSTLDLAGTTGEFESLRFYTESRRPDGLMDRVFGILSTPGSTRAQIIAAMQDLEEFGLLARQARARPNEAETIWLEETAESETINRRTLVHDIIVNRGDRFQLGNTLITPTVTIVTWQHWESFTSGAITYTASAEVAGIEYGDITPVGKLPNRIAKLVVTGGSTSDLVGKFWCGFRDTLKGTVDFEGYGLLATAAGGNIGTLGTDTSEQTDLAALTGTGSTAVECTFSTDATLAQRQIASLASIFSSATNYEHFCGQYEILVCFRAGSADTVWGVELRHGLTNDNRKNERVYLNSASTGNLPNTTNYHFIPMGQVDILGIPYRSDLSVINEAKFVFAIYAERLSGSGSLYWDSIILVPRPVVYFKATGTGDRVTLLHTEFDERYLLEEDSSNNKVANSAGGANGVLLNPDAALYVQAIGTNEYGERESGRVYAPSFDVYKRWANYAS